MFRGRRRPSFLKVRTTLVQREKSSEKSKGVILNLSDLSENPLLPAIQKKTQEYFEHCDEYIITPEKYTEGEVSCRKDWPRSLKKIFGVSCPFTSEEKNRWSRNKIIEHIEKGSSASRENIEIAIDSWNQQYLQNMTQLIYEGWEYFKKLVCGNNGELRLLANSFFGIIQKVQCECYAEYVLTEQNKISIIAVMPFIKFCVPENGHTPMSVLNVDFKMCYTYNSEIEKFVIDKENTFTINCRGKVDPIKLNVTNIEALTHKECEMINEAFSMIIKCFKRENLDNSMLSKRRTRSELDFDKTLITFIGFLCLESRVHDKLNRRITRLEENRNARRENSKKLHKTTKATFNQIGQEFKALNKMLLQPKFMLMLVKSRVLSKIDVLTLQRSMQSILQRSHKYQKENSRLEEIQYGITSEKGRRSRKRRSSMPITFELNRKSEPLKKTHLKKNNTDSIKQKLWNELTEICEAWPEKKQLGSEQTNKVIKILEELSHQCQQLTRSKQNSLKRGRLFPSLMLSSNREKEEWKTVSAFELLDSKNSALKNSKKKGVFKFIEPEAEQLSSKVTRGLIFNSQQISAMQFRNVPISEKDIFEIMPKILIVSRSQIGKYIEKNALYIIREDNINANNLVAIFVDGSGKTISFSGKNNTASVPKLFGKSVKKYLENYQEMELVTSELIFIDGLIRRSLFESEEGVSKKLVSFMWPLLDKRLKLKRAKTLVREAGFSKKNVEKLFDIYRNDIPNFLQELILSPLQKQLLKNPSIDNQLSVFSNYKALLSINFEQIDEMIEQLPNHAIAIKIKAKTLLWHFVDEQGGQHSLRVQAEIIMKLLSRPDRDYFEITEISLRKDGLYQDFAELCFVEKETKNNVKGLLIEKKTNVIDCKYLSNIAFRAKELLDSEGIKNPIDGVLCKKIDLFEKSCTKLLNKQCIKETVLYLDFQKESEAMEKQTDALKNRKENNPSIESLSGTIKNLYGNLLTMAEIFKKRDPEFYSKLNQLGLNGMRLASDLNALLSWKKFQAEEEEKMKPVDSQLNPTPVKAKSKESRIKMFKKFNNQFESDNGSQFGTHNEKNKTDEEEKEESEISSYC